MTVALWCFFARRAWWRHMILGIQAVEWFFFPSRDVYTQNQRCENLSSEYDLRGRLDGSGNSPVDINARRVYRAGLYHSIMWPRRNIIGHFVCVCLQMNGEVERHRGKKGDGDRGGRKAVRIRLSDRTSYPITIVSKSKKKRQSTFVLYNTERATRIPSKLGSNMQSNREQGVGLHQMTASGNRGSSPTQAKRHAFDRLFSLPVARRMMLKIK